MTDKSPLTGSEPEPESNPSETRPRGRSGFKREFEFAMRSQSELGASTGRTRSRTRKDEAPIAVVAGPSSVPRQQLLHVGSSSKSPVDGDGDEDPAIVDPSSEPLRRLYVGSSSKSPIVGDGDDRMEVEARVLNEVEMLKVSSDVRELLMTGLLDGQWIQCRAGIDKEIGLGGMIKDGKIFCFCNSCKGVRSFQAHQFVNHSGIKEGHPAECIYFESGKTFHDVLEECKAASVNMSNSSIQKVIGATPKSYACEKCRESFHTSSTGKFTLLCDSCHEPSREQSIPSIPNGSSECASKKTSSNKVTSGKLTKKDVGFHKLIFSNEELFKVIQKQTVDYIVGGETKLTGVIQNSGIFCLHCEKVISPSQFEAHAGHGRKRKPYHHIYLPDLNGASLHVLSVGLSKECMLPNREHDDLCSICIDGGKLHYCDLCPRAFHLECLRLSRVPKGKWTCHRCKNMHKREKSMEYNQNAIAAGRDASAYPVEQILQRCFRVKTPEINIGGCVFCRQQDFDTSRFGPRTVMICEQCQREHHVECLKAYNKVDLKVLPKAEWFCCTQCSMIYFTLQELIHKGAQPLLELNANVVKSKLKEKDESKEANVDLRWRLVSSKFVDADSKFLLSEATSIFSEKLTIVDDETEKNLIPIMVNGGKFSEDKDYTGMHCAVLTVSSSVKSAGIIRILTSEVAELPLVATRKDSQGLGYFGALFSCIERLLASLNVNHILLPSCYETKSMWIKKFGFSHVTQKDLHNCLKGVRTAPFEKTSMLWKPVQSAS